MINNSQYTIIIQYISILGGWASALLHAPVPAPMLVNKYNNTVSFFSSVRHNANTYLLRG